MKKLVAAALLVFIAFSARADGPSNELKARYSSMLKAIQALDIKGYHSFLADSYVSVDPDGKMSDRKAYLNDADTFFASAKSIKMDLKYTTTTVTGDTISQGFDQHVVVELKQGGVTSMHEVGTDTWKKIKGQWLVIKTIDKVSNVEDPK